MEIKQLVYDLANLIRRTVYPYLGKFSSRKPSGKAPGGDTTFVIDELAEAAVEDFLKGAGDIACYSEDMGLKVFGRRERPEYVLVIDPINGTRPAAAGLESCCTSVAASPYTDSPTMNDVVLAAVQEIKTGTMFFAEKGKGVEIKKGERSLKPVLSSNTTLSTLFWCIGFRGRPAEALVTVLGDLIDISSVDGGVFDIGSACFSMTRLITGQMDAYIDIGKRLVDEVTQVKKLFLEVGRGTVLNNNPYDVAAATLIAREGGCIITDGYGNLVNNYPILGSGLDFQFSVVGASNKELHAKVLREIDKGMDKLKRKYQQLDVSD